MKKIFFAAMLLLLVVPVVMAQNVTNTDADPIVDKIMGIVDVIIYIAGAIGTLLLVVTGIMFMQAGDPSEKKRMADRLKMILLGLLIVILAKPIINVILSA